MFSAHNRALIHLPLLQATVVNLAANTLCSGALGLALFEESHVLTARWLLGCALVVAGAWLIGRSFEQGQQKEREEKHKAT